MTEKNYELYLSYNPAEDSIAESFAFLSEVLKGQSKADHILLSGLEGGKVSSKTIMTDIKHSSIRAFLTNVVEQTKDEDIKEKGILAFWQQFLIEAKEPFIKYASSHKNLEKREDLILLRKETADIAEKNKVNPILIEGLSDDQVFACLEGYSVPAEHLGPKQSYRAKCNGQEYIINRDFNPTREALGESEKIYENQNIYLKPKKLCYSGDSMWEFTAPNGAPVKGKITDKEWLSDFQSGRLSNHEYPFPGTVLRVTADIIVKHDAAGFKKDIMATIKKVMGPVEDAASLAAAQSRLFE